MALARKYRLSCVIFQNFPSLFAYFSRKLGGASDGGSNGDPFAQFQVLRERKASTSDSQIDTNPALAPTLDDGTAPVENKTHMTQSSSYSTSTPIIPDVNFPLPGSTGLSLEFNSVLSEIRIGGVRTQSPTEDPEIGKGFKLRVLHQTPGLSVDEATSELASYTGFSIPAEEERVMNIAKFLKLNENLVDNTATSERGVLGYPGLLDSVTNNSNEGPIEVCTFGCPEFIKKEILLLFPRRSDLKNRKLILINLSHKTNNDMSGWSEQVEEERERVIKTFIDRAQLICEFFKKQSYFADFIDPMNGKPFYSAHTNHSLFETDELYEKCGFRIDDLGCCKVIHHETFGNNVFVGTIITDAPLSETFLKQ